MASFVYYNWYHSHFQYCPSPYSLSLTIRNILLLTYNHSTVRKRDILPCQSPPVWLSSPSRSCWGAECRHRTAPPSADPGWRRWGGSQIPSLRLSTTEGVKENRRQHYMTLSESVRLDVTHNVRGNLRDSPMRRISQRMSVSWMLLLANGHSCLSSRLLFSKTNWENTALWTSKANELGSLIKLRRNEMLCLNVSNCWMCSR